MLIHVLLVVVTSVCVSVPWFFSMRLLNKAIAGRLVSSHEKLEELAAIRNKDVETVSVALKGLDLDIRALEEKVAQLDQAVSAFEKVAGKKEKELVTTLSAIAETLKTLKK